MTTIFGHGFCNLADGPVVETDLEDVILNMLAVIENIEVEGDLHRGNRIAHIKTQIKKQQSIT